MKKMQKQDPFINQILDDEEHTLEEAFERGEFEEVTGSDLEKTKQMFQDAARLYKQLRMSKPITIRVNQLDLIKVKAKASAQNIPYQTLLGSLIHQYAEGEKSLQL